MQIPLRAKRAFTYDRRQLVPGQEFNAIKKSDAMILITVGHAEPLEYGTKVIAPEVKKSEIDMSNMELDELRAMASSLGIKVHHRSGPEKIRAAIRSAQT